MNFLNLKQMDALEFVQSLEGGWDTIIFDPPYINSKGSKRNYEVDPKNYKGWTHGNMFRLQERFIPDKNIELIFNEIIKKSNENAVIFRFDKIFFPYDDFIIWHKKDRRPAFPNKINNNCVFISIKYLGRKNIKKGYLDRIESIKPELIPNQFTITKDSAMKIPKKLYEKLFTWCNANYVLDPFAGSFNSAKACNKLNIKIDACDKYLEVPKISKTNLLNY